MLTQIQVEGTDARSFLQAQLSQDVETVGPRKSPFAAWCNPQGRVIAVLRIAATEAGLALLLPREQADLVRERLLKYRLRSRIQLTPAASDWRGRAVTAAADLAALAEAGLLPDADDCSSRRAGDVLAVRLTEDCVELYGTDKALDAVNVIPATPLDEAAWRGRRIGAGIPDLDSARSERFTPHMLNLDLLGAVSFSKGCYPGQEVVARTQHKGSSKRRLQHYRCDAAVIEGSMAKIDGRDAGEVVAAANGELLVLLPTDVAGTDIAIDGRIASAA